VALLPLVGGLVGGLALFLLGLDQLTSALRSAAGDRLRRLLSRMSRNPATAATGGAVTTAVLQSSSVTTVLVIGFVSAGLLSLPQAAGVIIGANLGSTFVLASQGLLTLPTAIAVTLGANIGTCVTARLAVATAPTQKQGG
jgi:phosphate:Na+ symporter